jgi:hypothetical protein
MFYHSIIKETNYPLLKQLHQSSKVDSKRPTLTANNKQKILLMADEDSSPAIIKHPSELHLLAN